MKKIFFLLLIIFTISGCEKPNFKINMIIEKDNNKYIAINYPFLNIKKIDNLIKNYIDDSYINFIYNGELNIDYEYYNLEDYISIILKKYEYFENNIYNDIFTIAYDKDKKKIIEFDDIIKDKINFKKLLREKLFKKYPNLDLSDIVNLSEMDIFNFILGKNLIVYLKCNYEYIDIVFEYNELNLDIKYMEKVFANYKNIESKNIIDCNDKVIALTFDDGPSIYTEEIIDILNENKAVATFFVLGNKLKDYGDIVKKAYLNGNELGNHSFNHKWLSKLSIEEINYQIDRTNEEIKKIIGKYPVFLRPTYGSINSKIRNNTSMKIALWNIDPKDWRNKTSEAIASDILKKVTDEDIILLHDTHHRTVKALKILIPKLKEKGYQFVTLSELEEIKKIRKMN